MGPAASAGATRGGTMTETYVMVRSKCAVCNKPFPCQGLSDGTGANIDWSENKEVIVCSFACAVSLLQAGGSFKFEVAPDYVE